jgi:hypothetical protein
VAVLFCSIARIGGDFASADRQSVPRSRVDRESARLCVEIATVKSALRLRCAGFTSISAAFVPIFESWIWP